MKIAACCALLPDQDNLVRDWEVHKVLTIDLGLELSDDDKQVRDIAARVGRTESPENRMISE